MTIARILSSGPLLPLVMLLTFPAHAQEPAQAACCRSSLEITASRTVFLLVTAPNGFETGYDPTAFGGFVNEIPSSTYSLGFAGNGSAENPRVERKLEIGTPAAGRYTVQAIGASPGNFTIDFKATDERGRIVTRQFRGVTRPGRTAVYFVQYSPVPGTEFSVTPLAPFSSFSADVTILPTDQPPTFRVSATIGLASASSFDPVAQPLTFHLGSYAVTIPPGSFLRKEGARYDYDGTIDGITLDARILPEAGNKFAFKLKVQGINISSSINPVRVLLILGDNAGAKNVNAVTP